MRPSDDGGPDLLSNGGNTWHFKLDGIYPGSTSGMTLQEVKALVEPIQPDRVAAAGASYQRASQKLTELASNLISHGQKLAGAWGGETAPKAISQMQQLHDTAIDLANTSQGTASVLHWYGSTIQPWYKSQIQNMNDTVGDKVAGFLSGTDPANTAAANQLAKLNARTVEAYNSIPPAANKNLPPLTGGYGAPGSGNGAAAVRRQWPGSGAGGSGGGTASGGSARPSQLGSSAASRGSGNSASGAATPAIAVIGGGPGSPVTGGGHGTLSGFNPTPGAGAPGGRGAGGPAGWSWRGSALAALAPERSWCTAVAVRPILPGPVIGGSPPGSSRRVTPCQESPCARIPAGQWAERAASPSSVNLSSVAGLSACGGDPGALVSPFGGRGIACSAATRWWRARWWRARWPGHRRARRRERWPRKVRHCADGSPVNGLGQPGKPALARASPVAIRRLRRS